MTTRPSPPKPHEIAKGSAGGASGGPAIARMTEFERARATSALRSSAPASSGMGASTTSSVPGLPPRTSSSTLGGYGSSYGGSSYGTSTYGSGYGGYGSSYGGYGSRYGSPYSSTYGSGYGSSYGGYGGGYGSSYGGRYGGYGSSYGGYGSSYGGGYGGYRSGMYGRPGMEGPPMEGQMPDSLLHRVGYFVDTFGRFSQLLDMNCDAIYGTFSSVLRVLESLSFLKKEFFFVFQTWTFFRVLQLLVQKFNFFGQHLIGRATGATPAIKGDMLDLDAFSNFQDKKVGPAKGRASGTLGWVLFFVSIVIGPIIVNRLWRKLRESLPPMDPMDDAWGGPSMKATALFDFEAQTPQDLPFRKGDVIRILNNSDKHWWEGEFNGRVGMLPSNYVEPIISGRPVPPEPKITPIH